MTFFTDFKDAVIDYPSTGVNLSIVSVAANNPVADGTSINEDEVWKFKVSVNNHGFVDMSGVMLHINGQNGAKVAATAAGPFGTSTISVGPLDVDSGTTKNSAYVYFKAPSTAQNPAALVEAHISEWDADLTRILIGDSGHASTPSATYVAEVFPA